jgi:hypothetical protein
VDKLKYRYAVEAIQRILFRCPNTLTECSLLGAAQRNKEVREEAEDDKTIGEGKGQD